MKKNWSQKIFDTQERRAEKIIIEEYEEPNIEIPEDIEEINREFGLEIILEE